MAGFCWLLGFSYIISLLISPTIAKLNVPRVLLPVFKDLSTKFTLEDTDDGCYKWSTTRPDLISLTPQEVDAELDCSPKVLISTATKESKREVGVVLAEDIYTKKILRCDVILDVITSLHLATTTRELFMGEAPEMFEVIAYDAQGNIFSTLEGVEFNWEILAVVPNREQNVLRFLKFKDSQYDTPSTVEEIESQNKNGHIVLLEGIKTGSAKVTARLPYKEYKEIKLDEVQLSVIANLIILPSDAYIMVGDTIRFQIIQMSDGKLEEIELPHSQYYLEVNDRNVAVADKYNSDVSGLKVGKTEIILYDRDMDKNDAAMASPKATINVVMAAYMTINLLPHKNWAIIQSELHHISVEIYSSDDHKIFLGNNVEIYCQVGELFHVQERTKNGSWLTGWGKEEGVAEVQATLEAVVHPKIGKFRPNSVITARAELLIFPPIILSPSEVILPCDPRVKPKYELEVKALGGDGKFLWSSSDHAVGIVTQTGHVRTHACGNFEVCASMLRNHNNRQTAPFYILPPTHLEIVEFVMEAEVGSSIFLHVALFADKPHLKKDSGVTTQIPFTKCQDLPFKVQPSDPNFIYNKSSVIAPSGISCANVAIVGLNVGVSKITVTYNSHGKTLEDSVTVSTYKPLRLLHPRHCEITLALGTSIQVIYTGGPKPTVGRPSLHKRVVESQDSLIVDAKDITDTIEDINQPDVTVIQVTCLELGSSEVTLSITNSPLLPNCRNQESSSKITVVCSQPHAVYLQPKVKIADVRSCPLDISADRVVVQSYNDIELDTIVTDENGRPFLNATSLDFEWSINPLELGRILYPNQVLTRNLTDGGLIFANGSYQIIEPKMEKGILDVGVQVKGYLHDKLKAHGIYNSEWPQEDGKPKVLVAGIHLYLVNDVTVVPNATTIYNHPGNKKRLAAKQGSGYFQFDLSSTSIADVSYLEETREIEVMPMNDGDLEIKVIDLCLVSQPVTILIKVVSVHIIRIEMSDKIELGKCVSCIVKLYDELDNLLDVSNLDMVELKHVLEDDIIAVKKLKEEKDNPWPIGEIHYAVTGLDLGDTKLSFAIGDTVSAPVDVQVFPPLRIHPRNATILAGSVLQFSSKGGPRSDANIEYFTDPQNVADISIIGLAEGLKLGRIPVHATAVGMNPTTGLKVTYSQDTVNLQVIPLSGITMHTPLTRFQIGATVPVWASGVPEQLSPMILGTLRPPIRFEWTVDDSEIITIQGSFEEHGIEYLPEDKVSIRITGISAGRTRLHLTAIVPGFSTNRPDKSQVIYTVHLDLEVIETLTLVSPGGIAGRLILMAPQSSVQLQTNMDGIVKLRYSLTDTPSAWKKEETSLSIPNPVVKVSEDGVLISQGTLGRSMILITSVDELGLEQTLSLIVEVKPIHYMLLNVITNWRVQSRKPIYVVPLGTEFELRASYHDNVGSTFATGNMELKLRSTRFDLVKIRPGYDNSSIFIQTKKPGYTVLKVWSDGVDKTLDYIKLHIGHTMSPIVDHLTTGDILCIWTPLVTTVKQVSRWSSSERSLVTLDVKTGIGRVVSFRGGQVSIGHTLHSATPLHLQVIPANKILMLTPSYTNRVLTNAPDSLVYRVPLVITTENDLEKSGNLIHGWQCQDELESSAINFVHNCYLQFNNETAINVNHVFITQSGFDAANGQYTCDILPGPDHNPNISTLYSNISVWATLEGTEVEANPIELPFVPAVFVNPELVLDSNTFEALLSIYGVDYVLDQINVKPVDDNLLGVDGENRPQPNLLTFRVSLIDYHWKLDELGDPLNLIVSSKLTDQVIKIHVTIQSGRDLFGTPECIASKHSPLVSFIYRYRYTLCIVLSMFVIFLLTFYAYTHYLQPVITVNVRPNRPSLNSSTNLSGRLSRSPFTSPCAAAAYAQNLQRTPDSPTNRSNSEPIYGEPNNFYSSPEIRRSRRFM